MEEPLRVLMVEDSEDDAALVLRFVRQGGRKVECRRVETEVNMREALDTGKWDLVISDYHMPRFSGSGAIRILRDFSTELPLIIVSGTVGEDIAIEALKNGATDYVLKNNLARLPSAIDRALREMNDLREKHETAKQLVQAQKMESIGRLAGGVAHDVNNVLAAIALFAEMAIDQLQHDDFDEVKKSLQGIIKAQESAAAIIRQLLLFSRRRIGPSEVADFSAILSDIRPLVARLVGEGIDLEFNIPPTPLLITADKTQLEQIILNLSVNARDAMKNHGKLSLTLEPYHVETVPSGMLLPMKPGDYIVLTARDTGSGMSAEVQQKIFEPFFSTKEPGKGTGLGLSVIFGILRQVGGSISVESGLEKGTTFQIYWPVAKVPAFCEFIPHVKPPQAKPAEPALIESLTLLLVEDEEALRKILAETLRKKGHKVLEASQGEEALQRMKESTSPVSLLITDVIMPKMNGPTLAKRARELRPDLGVLFLSGYVDQTLEEHEVGPHLTWFLEKPFTSQELIKKVTDIMTAGSSQTGDQSELAVGS